MHKVLFIFMALLIVVACNSTINVQPAISTTPVSSDGGGGGGGGEGGGGGGDPWWDALTSYDNNVTFHTHPDSEDGANPTDLGVFVDDAFMYEYDTNRVVILDDSGGNAPVLRFITVNSDNTLTANAVTAIPYSNMSDSISDAESNVVHFASDNKIILSQMFEPVGGTPNMNDLVALSYDTTTYAVTVESIQPETTRSTFALSSDDSKLIAFFQNLPSNGEITWKVYDASNLSGGALQTGSFDFTSIFPGPAFTVGSLSVRKANFKRIRNNDFIFSLVLEADDITPTRVYDSLVMMHVRLNGDNTVTVDNFKKDIVTNASLGNILQYVDETYVVMEESHYLRQIDDDYFAISGNVDMERSIPTFGSTNLLEAFVLLGKLESDNSITLGSPTITQVSEGGDYPNFWVYPDTNEIILMTESYWGEDHLFSRAWLADEPIAVNNYTLPGYSKADIIENPQYFVADFASLPAGPQSNMYTTTDNGKIFGWNNTSNAWEQLTSIYVSMIGNDGVGFDLYMRSAWGTPIFVLTYDTATLSITRKKKGAAIYEQQDYREDVPVVDDLWRFHGAKLADGRIVVGYSSDGEIIDTTTYTSKLMVLSK